MPPNDLEEELLRRFQALKSPPSAIPSVPSSSSLSFKGIHDEQARRAKEGDEELERIADGRPLLNSVAKEDNGVEDEMARRMARLKGIEYEADEGDDQEVDDFIASLSASTPAFLPNPVQSKVNAAPDPSRDKKSLRKEAQEALKATRGYVDASDDKGDEGDAEGEEDFETEDEILLRALEEAELEAETRSKNPENERGNEGDEIPYEKETEEDILARARTLASVTDINLPPSSNRNSEPEFSFPSLPTHVPVDEADEDDKDAAARMALLLGLSGPSTKPGPRLPSPPKDIRQPGQGWNLPGYKDDNDEDPDSWCCICNKDAEVVCLGCEGDPYCEECWAEGHVGERHRTKRFAGKGGRKAIGA